MIVEIHPVIIPPDLKLARNIKKNLRHTDGKLLDESDLLQYDQTTVFYDVFFNPSNTILYALGPPLLNLEDELSSIVISVNDIQVKHERLKFSGNQLNILCVKFNNKTLQSILERENNVSIDFGNKWTWQARIPLNQLKGEVLLTLSSMQKNNKLRWIKDWIRYYKEVHGVERVILYDNGSDYQSTLDQELNTANLYVVPWNFLFGPYRSHSNQFCQVGSLNHCRLKFSNSKFCLNFDVDEILIIKDNKKLVDCMNQYAVIYFDGFAVPFVKPNKEDYSYSDFVLRKQISTNERYKSYKYMCKLAHVNESLPHKVLTNTHGLIISSISKLLQKLNKFLVQRFKLSLYSLIPYGSVNDSYWFNPKDGYFLSFVGITTNWKSSYWNRLKERKDISDLIEDRSVADFFER